MGGPGDARSTQDMRGYRLGTLEPACWASGGRCAAPWRRTRLRLLCYVPRGRAAIFWLPGLGLLSIICAVLTSRFLNRVAKQSQVGPKNACTRSRWRRGAQSNTLPVPRKQGQRALGSKPAPLYEAVRAPVSCDSWQGPARMGHGICDIF